MSDLATWEREKAELVEKYNGHIAEMTAREQKLLRSIEKNLAEAEAKRAITAAGGSAVLLLPHVMKEVRVIEDGDDFTAIVVANDGKTRRIKDGAGNPMTIVDLVAEFQSRPSFGSAFDAAGGSDGGGVGDKGGPHKVTISTADARDNRKYVAAKEAAVKAGVELETVEPEPSPSEGTYKIGRADAKDHRRYVAAREEAQKAGAPLEIVD